MPTRVMAGLFLSPLAGVYGDAVNEFNNPEQRFVVNGWIGEKASEDPNCLFAGVFIGNDPNALVEWMKKSRFSLGCGVGPLPRCFVG